MTINTLRMALMSRYKMRDLGDLDKFLGIRVIQDRPARKLWLSQELYINKLASKFHLELHQPVFTPLPANKLVPNDSTATLQQIYTFQQRVDSIMFTAVVTQADAAYAVNISSRIFIEPITATFRCS